MTQDSSDWNPEGMKSLATRYLALLSTKAPKKARVVDKMPINFAGLGVIHAVFPNAKIIHVRRNPVDTCISIYTTPNRGLTEFGHDRGNIVFAYRQYQRLMEHWRQALPSGTMLEVDYEALVGDREAASRQIVDFVGEAWSDLCLQPEKNARTVVTPSVWQVRQPVYKTSVERWRRFEPWLGAFRALLPST
jgi:hypothetical protein